MQSLAEGPISPHTLEELEDYWEVHGPGPIERERKKPTKSQLIGRALLAASIAYLLCYAGSAAWHQLSYLF